MAQDQLIWEKFAYEYNDRRNLLYGRHAHESVPRNLDPSEFEPIALEHWKIFAQFLRTYLQTWRTHYRGGSCLGITVT